MRSASGVGFHAARVLGPVVGRVVGLRRSPSAPWALDATASPAAATDNDCSKNDRRVTFDMNFNSSQGCVDFNLWEANHRPALYPAGPAQAIRRTDVRTTRTYVPT